MDVIFSFKNVRNTMSGKKRILTGTVLSCIICVILISGCTMLNAGNIENAPAATATTAAETPAPATPQSAQSDNTDPVLSWSDIYPEYDEQTKQRLIEEAKDEIVRIYPDVDRSTLDGYWVDHDSGYGTKVVPTAYGPPRIIFENVDDTSEKYMELQKLRSRGIEANVRPNIVMIRVDPESGNIVFYGGESMSWPLKEEIRTVSFEDSEDKCLEFLRKVKGNDFVDGKINDFSFCNIDTDANSENGLAFIIPFNTCNGVQYMYDQLYMQYDLILDRVIRYWDKLKDPELMTKLTTLSPEPTISKRKAKQILEEKLSESYPGEDLQIQYHVWNDFENNVLWYDKEELVYSQQPEPIRLIWYISFNDEKMRNEDSRLTTTAIIDAHTGEIISLRYRDIAII
ncbi:hypothetical protein [Methanogenium organophilum]|uniref:Uncharacterized protein n=1 Tax=Methanogenium organophilum TaxID=2199 RepID=A0A9X9S4M8_METOG|nr:hypothetical protein [Methanogenium organophilum]WAI01393.1 hypothetical protein OU421_00525 [Methanogenium organophilum]